MAHGLTDVGHRVIVLAGSLSRDQHYRDKSVEVYRIVPRFDPHLGRRRLLWRLSWVWSGYQLTFTLKLLEIIRRQRIDLIESPEMHSETFFFSLLPRKRPPLVVRLHAGATVLHNRFNYEPTASLRRAIWMERTLLQRANGISAPSIAAADATRQSTGLTLRDIEVVPNPVDTETFHPLKSEIKSKPVVLFAGGINQVKGIELLKEVIPTVLDKVREAEFWFVGPSPADAASLLDQMKAEWRARIKLLGFLPRASLPDIYAQAKVVVLTSPWESFGYTCAEAMACGKPVVCVAGSGPEEIIGQCPPLLINPRDAKGFADRVVYILRLEEPVYDELAARVRSRILQKCASGIVVPRMVAFYRQVLARRAR